MAIRKTLAIRASVRKAARHVESSVFRSPPSHSLRRRTWLLGGDGRQATASLALSDLAFLEGRSRNLKK